MMIEMKTHADQIKDVLKPCIINQIQWETPPTLTSITHALLVTMSTLRLIKLTDIYSPTCFLFL